MLIRAELQPPINGFPTNQLNGDPQYECTFVCE